LELEFDKKGTKQKVIGVAKEATAHSGLLVLATVVYHSLRSWLGWCLGGLAWRPAG